MSELEEFNATILFNELDLNKNNRLDPFELQVILRSRDFFPGTPFFKMSYMLNQKIKKNLY